VRRASRGARIGEYMTVTNAVETTMIWGTVSGASMVGMVISLLLSVVLPIFLGIFIYKKTKAWVPAFFIGCGIFVGFAMILEQICHAIVLTVTGSAIRDNIWLYAIYGGLAAALFEECGRWIAMTFCLKKHLTRENALMYGAGHGGIEAFLILGMSSMSNLLTAAMINGGLMEKTMTALEPAQQEVTYHQLSVLWTTCLPVLSRTGGADQCDRSADRIVDSCIQCGEDRQKAAFGSSLRTAFCSGLLNRDMRRCHSHLGIGTGTVIGGCSDLCSGIPIGICTDGREKIR